MLLKIVIIIVIVLLVLFILSLFAYFFNWDMKIAAGMDGIMTRHYDRAKEKRDRKTKEK